MADNILSLLGNFIIYSITNLFFSVVLNSIIFFSKALSKIPPQANGPQDYMGKKKQVLLV